jgi:multidrug resistance efflux pump
MLNISDQSINHLVDEEKYVSIKNTSILYQYSYKRLRQVISLILLTFFIILLLPWTQNVRSKGNLISLSPDQRPQTIQSVIAGRIEKWYVQEGQFVEKGDTILNISEVKEEYLDPQLLDNTQQQIDAKVFSGTSYESKAQSLDNQIEALQTARRLKIEQTQNKIQQNILKVTSDSMDFEAAKINNQIALEQYERIKGLHAEGLRSLTDLENRKNKWQEAQAKMISQENKLLSSKNELIISRIELNGIQAEYNDKIAKANAEKFTALSSMYDTDATVNKLRNQYANYKIRNDMYYITAPQSGYVTQAKQVGIGETIKEGEPIVSIMPEKYDLAIEMFVRPIDLPLFEKGQKVMIQFDGWPAVIFSGWPAVSYGTYEGKVLAVDNFISDNNLFRVLVQQDPDAPQWPEALRVGGGVKTFTLLKNVQVWYEIWRQINGFPPDYYKTQAVAVKK